MTLTKIIEEARKAYRNSGVKLSLPHRDYVSTPGHVRLSALDNCPLQHAYEKLRIDPDFPELTADGDPSKAWVMDHGNYVAPMIQEALMYWAMTKEGVAFEPELPVILNDLKAVGRIDGVLTLNGRKRVIEIKDAEGLEKRSVGEPKLSYCLQALGYCLGTGIPDASIIIVSKWGFRVYDLVTDGDDTYTLYHEESGTPYQPPVWMENFNTPQHLSFARVEEEIEKLHWYMEEIERYEVDPEPPIEDPLNHTKGWLCARHPVKPTKTKNGVMYVSCPFAMRCHGWQKTSYETEKTANGYQIVVPF